MIFFYLASLTELEFNAEKFDKSADLRHVEKRKLPQYLVLIE